MKETLVTFVRHGQNEYANEGTEWHAGPHLNKQGQKEAEQTARFLRRFPFDVVLCSDMNRTRETAIAICRQQPLVKPAGIVFYRELAEHDEIVYGYTHKTSQIDKNEEIAKARRTVKFFQKMLREHRGKKILVVAHGNVIRACLGTGMGFALEESPEINFFTCSVSSIAFCARRFKGIFHLNMVDHLGERDFKSRLQAVKFASHYSFLDGGAKDGKKETKKKK